MPLGWLQKGKLRHVLGQTELPPQMPLQGPHPAAPNSSLLPLALAELSSSAPLLPCPAPLHPQEASATVELGDSKEMLANTGRKTGMGMGTGYGDRIWGEVELHLGWGPMPQSRCGAYPLKFLSVGVGRKEGMGVPHQGRDRAALTAL